MVIFILQRAPANESKRRRAETAEGKRRRSRLAGGERKARKAILLKRTTASSRKTRLHFYSIPKGFVLLPQLLSN
jgi:hypothetical protein